MAGRRLSFAGIVPAAAVALLAIPAFAGDVDRICIRETAPRAAGAVALHAAIDAIFDRVPTPGVQTEDGVTGDFETMEVLVVRVKDGKPVLACVDTKEAAKRFLNAPVESIGGKTAEEK